MLKGLLLPVAAAAAAAAAAACADTELCWAAAAAAALAAAAVRADDVDAGDDDVDVDVDGDDAEPPDWCAAAASMGARAQVDCVSARCRRVDVVWCSYLWRLLLLLSRQFAVAVVAAFAVVAFVWVARNAHARATTIKSSF